MRELERVILLRTVDRHWMFYIDEMHELRQEINLRAYGQRDPLVEYRLESFEMFEGMIRTIQEEVVRGIYQARVAAPPRRRAVAGPAAAIRPRLREAASNGGSEKEKGAAPAAKQQDVYKRQELGFDYLRDNMVLYQEELVQRELNYAIVDEVDSILIDEARTPLIISSRLETRQEYSRFRGDVEQLLRKQNRMVGDLLNEAREQLEQGNRDEAAEKMLLVRRGAPKNKNLLKLIKERGMERLVERTKQILMTEKRLNQFDEQLYFTIDEITRAASISQQGYRELVRDNPGLAKLLGFESAPEDAVPDSAGEEEESGAGEQLHCIHQLLKAYSLYEKDVDYVVQDGKVVIVDEFTGRLMWGRRYSEGLHQAIEAKDCLLYTSELEQICGKLAGRPSFLYANNIQSADMVAFTVPEGFAAAPLPAMDNSLAMTLRDQCGLELELMPQTLGLLFDLDTPADVLVLGAGPFAGPRARVVLDELVLDYSRLERAKEVLMDSYRDVALIGRVGAPIIERLNALLKLRLRVFSEERGMKALGRQQSGAVVSLIGFLMEHSGVAQFFSYLAQVASCAFIDSRVLFAHHNYDFTDRERFLSDLGLWEQIEHPWLKEFTRAAVQCSIPVLLGGHSLVSGSLWALTCELDPARRDRQPAE